MVCVMKDDLIDDSGFELGLPTREEMLKHQCDLLFSELDVTRRDLRQAHRNLAGVIVMYQECTKELSALKTEHQRVSMRLAQFYEADRAQEVKQMGYAYGDYSKKVDPPGRR